MARKSTINRVTKFMLVLFGIWPDAWCIMFCRTVWSITIGIVLFSHYRYLSTHYNSVDVFDLADCFSSFLGYSKLITKFICFWMNQRIFDEMLVMMAEDWDDCANNDIEMRETMNKAKTSDRISNAIVALHMVAALSYGIGVILADVDVTDRTIELPHIHKVELSLTINTQRAYKVILIIELTHVVLCSWGISILNSLLLTLTLHVGGQINILRCWLKEVPKASEKKHESVVTTMSRIIRKHQKIIYFSENIENLYSFIALLQFMSNTVMICLLGFLIVTALGSPDATGKIMRSLSYYSVTNIEAFMFCYAGEYLINKSTAIGAAAYNTVWYDLKFKHSRILLLLILRSQKQLTLTVGKMTDLSLQCFAKIMNCAASYLSVLLAMQ